MRGGKFTMLNEQTYTEKKSRRMVIQYTKQMLKKNAELLKENYNIDIPKDIMNMDNLDTPKDINSNKVDFKTFITKKVYPPIITKFLKENSKFIKENFNVEIPSNFNMEISKFYDFLSETLTAKMIMQGEVSPEIRSIIFQLQACLSVYRNYDRLYRYKPSSFQMD